MPQLLQLLRCEPPSPKEINWNWKNDRINIEEALSARGNTYNGYPVSRGYFGAYCMDGLAMSLWALYRSGSFFDCIYNVVNLLGDADTTGAICGQMAGAYYGYSSLARDNRSEVMLRNLKSWDPFFEIPLRAALLCAEASFANDARPPSALQTNAASANNTHTHSTSAALLCAEAKAASADDEKPPPTPAAEPKAACADDAYPPSALQTKADDTHPPPQAKDRDCCCTIL